jgi:uncharacterized protein YceH (UPF0502 family)
MESLTDIEIRILGTLIEKSMATPEYYPLTLKGLRAGCNQATNRVPVTDYEEIEIELGVKSLKLKGLIYFIEPKGGHEVRKYEHTLFEEHRWQMNRGQVALLGMMLLRGEQTASELRTRVKEKMIDLSPAVVEELLESLSSLEESPILRVPRQPGQREPRWRHRLAIHDIDAPGLTPAMADADSDEVVSIPLSVATRDDLQYVLKRLEALEERVRQLES